MSAKKILIVEDELITANDIKETLENNGYQVSAMVRTGEKALLEVKQNRPDGVIMDIHLAGEITGVEAAREIAVGNGIPVIFLTANDNIDILHTIRQMTNVSYLTKPLRISDLVSNLAIALNNLDEPVLETNTNKLQDAVYIPVKNGHQKLNNNDFLYAEASGSYVTIFTRNNPLVVSTNLGNLHKQIGNHIFIRISRKHLVNMHMIEKIEGNLLVISGKTLPVGESYRNEVFKKLQIIKTK